MRGKGEYVPGTTVFAKLKGYPWWPARVGGENSVQLIITHESIDWIRQKCTCQSIKAKDKIKRCIIYRVLLWFKRLVSTVWKIKKGTENWKYKSGFFGPDAIRPFNHDIVQSDLKAKKFKTKDLELAVRQALNPSLLKKEEEEEEEEEVKPEKTTKKKIESKKKEKIEEPKTKRRNHKEAIREEEIEENDQKRRRKSISVEKEEGSPQTNDIKEDFKKTPEYKHVYHIRHKLQRLVYNKKEVKQYKLEEMNVMFCIKGWDSKRGLFKDFTSHKGNWRGTNDI